MRLFAALAVLAAAAAMPREPQLRPPLAPPQFRTGVEVVEVDVSVLDDKRRPVRGLTAADFTVLEDGQRQEILSFSAVDVSEAVGPPTGWMREVAADVRSNLAAADRLIVLVLDDAQVRSMPQHTRSVKDMSRAVIDRLGANDLMAVVFTRDNRGAQPFTNDRQRLLAAVDGFHGEFNPDMGEYFAISSLRTLRFVAESLSDAAQRRKAVLYISPGVPISGTGADMDQRRREVKSIVEEARRANVNVYALDPSGLGGLDAEDPAGMRGVSQNTSNDLLHLLAVDTGGRAVVNRNDGVGGVNEVFAENASYYLVAYRSNRPEAGSRFRKIDVRVNRPGVTVRARSGYIPARARTDAKDGGQSAALVKAMRDAAPKGDVSMQMTAAPFAMPDNKKVTLAIAIALRQPRLAMGGALVEYLQLMVAAYEPDGKRGPFERLNARVALKATNDPFVYYEVLTGLQMTPGRYQLRVAAQSALHAKEGSLHYDVVVPDFSKGDLKLSGVLVSAEPNVPAAGVDRLSAVVPVIPTSRREFWSTDRVGVFVRVYRNMQGIDPVTLKLRVQDQHGRTVYERSDTAVANRLGTLRVGDYRAALPVEQLAPGPHLVTLEANSGRETVRRDVRIIRR